MVFVLGFGFFGGAVGVGVGFIWVGIGRVSRLLVWLMKDLCNYTIGDVVRLKETGDLVVIDNYLGCRSCVLYEQYCRNPDSCHVKTGCYGEGKAFGGKSVYFKPVKE